MDIKDKHTLSVLMKALYVAKWEADDEASNYSRELSGSPLLADLYRNVVDAFALLDTGPSAAPRQWEKWREIEGRPNELAKTRERIRAISGAWASWPVEKKAEFVRTLLSPFTANDETMASLIGEQAG